MILVQDLIHMYNRPEITLNDVSIKSRTSVLKNLLKNNITELSESIIETSNILKTQNLSNSKIAMILKSIALYYTIVNIDNTRSKDFYMLAAEYSNTLIYTSKTIPKIPKSKLDQIVDNCALPSEFRFIISLFIDAPLRTNDFKYIKHLTSLPDLKSLDFNFIYKTKFYVKGTKNGQEYSKKCGYDIYTCSKKTLDLFKQCNYAVDMSPQQLNKYLNKWLTFCFGDQINTLGKLRHSITDWANPTAMHHSIVTHCKYSGTVYL